MKGLLLVGTAMVLAGCAPGDRDATNSGDTLAQVQGMPMNSGMTMGSSGMRGSMMQSIMTDPLMMADSAGGMHGSMQMQPAKDGDQMFLRMMSDHHDGLVQVSMKAMDKGSTDAVKSFAHQLHLKQAAERDSMVAHLKRDYQEQHQAMPMKMNQAQADSVASHDGADYDRAYYQFVLNHHRDGIMMIDYLLPRLQKPAVRQMAEKMKADQEREIQEIQRRLNQAG